MNMIPPSGSSKLATFPSCEGKVSSWAAPCPTQVGKGWGWGYIFLLLLFALACAAPAKTIQNYLGETYIAVMKDYGFPNAIFPVRDAVASRDDVVFNYRQSFFYFYNNHLYRAFFSSQYQEEILPGLKIGDKKNRLTDLFGQDYQMSEDGLVWRKLDRLIVAKMDEKNRLKTIWFILQIEK